METFSALLAICAGKSPVNSPHKGQWRRSLMFSLICAWINCLVNDRETGDLRRRHAQYDVMLQFIYVTALIFKSGSANTFLSLHEFTGFDFIVIIAKYNHKVVLPSPNECSKNHELTQHETQNYRVRILKINITATSNDQQNISIHLPLNHLLSSCAGRHKRKHESSASLVFVKETVDSP